MGVTISDVIQLIGIIFSLITGIVAIVISVLTLRQNSKMIEDSTRPYIGIYGISAFIGFRQYYIVVKNFGQSSALIESFTYDIDIAKFAKHDGTEPFAFIDGTTVMPGQSFRSAIDFDKALHETKCIHFHVRYSSGTHKYEDDICLKLDGNLGNFETHNTGLNKLKIISETLQDSHIKSL